MAADKPPPPIHRGRVFLLVKENVTLDNGRPPISNSWSIRGRGHRSPGRVRQVVLIRQYRHAVGQYIWRSRRDFRGARTAARLRQARADQETG
jgi:hypothetical protein